MPDSFDEEEVKGLLRRGESSTSDDGRAMARIGNGNVARNKHRRKGASNRTTDTNTTFSRSMYSVVPVVVGATILGFFTGDILFTVKPGSSQDGLDIPTMQHSETHHHKQQQTPPTPVATNPTPVATTSTKTSTIAATTTTTTTSTSTTQVTTEATTVSSTTMAQEDAQDGIDDTDNIDDDDNVLEEDQDDDDPIKYYMSVRTDRSGSALCGYLLLHSHAFATNNTYGGACWDTIDWKPYVEKHGEKFIKKVEKRLEDVKRLTNLLGLEKELPYACPSDKDLESGKAIFFKKRGQYKIPGYTTEWLKYLQEKSTFQYAPPRGNDEPLDVVLHLRRGDFTPCHVMDRYLSNTYYLKVMRKYLPPLCDKHKPGCKITAYTEEQTYESFGPFVEEWPNIVFDYDSSLEDIWGHFMNADVFIMSKSSFSQVPAMMNRGTYVISPYVVGEFGMEEDIPTWIKVDPDILHEAEQFSKNISDTSCTPNDRRGRYTSYYEAHPDEKLPGKDE